MVEAAKTMFVQERRDKIVELINQQGQVRVKDLSEQFNVTEDLIRKDLVILDRGGHLSRTYGGAVRNRTNPHEFDVAQRKDKNTEAKAAIAARAFSLVNAGDFVFLDISTANVELARLIVQSSLELTVVSNMVDVMLQFTRPTRANFVFIGGNFSSGRDGFIGSLAIEEIERFHFDIAFMGVVEVDLYRNSVETYTVEDGLTKAAILKQSRKKYMQLESKKFNNEGTVKYSQIDDFTGIITEKALPDAIMKGLSRFEITIIA
jgi:DeoR family glycerol-3-phosphate regulon repressor